MPHLCEQRRQIQSRSVVTAGRTVPFPVRRDSRTISSMGPCFPMYPRYKPEGNNGANNLARPLRRSFAKPGTRVSDVAITVMQVRDNVFLTIVWSGHPEIGQHQPSHFTLARGRSERKTCQTRTAASTPRGSIEEDFEEYRRIGAGSHTLSFRKRSSDLAEPKPCAVLAASGFGLVLSPSRSCSLSVFYCQAPSAHAPAKRRSQ